MPPAPAQRPVVSLLFPALNEIENVEGMVAFFRQIRTTYASYLFEMIVVDDGSTDGTAERVWELVRPDEAVQVIRFSRNFGSHAALSAGLAHAFGDAAITLSADRSEPLEAIGQFLQEWRSGADIVWGLRSVRAQRRAGAFFSRLFSFAFQRAADLSDYPVEGPSQMLVTRQVMDTLNSLPENNRNVVALAAWTGYQQSRVYYEQLPRPHGRSKWTFAKKLKLVVDSFVEFSHAPTTWIAAVGAILSSVGFLLALASIVMVATGLSNQATTAVICAAVLFVGGLNIAATAMIGEYLWRVGADVRQRPVYIVKSLARTASAEDIADGSLSASRTKPGGPQT